jgi:hypothetical protein
MTPLKRLGHEISHHFLGGAPLDLNLLHIDPAVIKKYPILMCPAHFPIDSSPFISISMELLLPCNKIFSVTP